MRNERHIPEPALSRATRDELRSALTAAPATVVAAATRVVRAVANIEPKLSAARREEIKASIERVCEYGEDLEQYGIDSFKLSSDKLTKLYK